MDDDICQNYLSGDTPLIILILSSVTYSYSLGEASLCMSTLACKLVLRIQVDRYQETDSTMKSYFH